MEEGDERGLCDARARRREDVDGVEGAAETGDVRRERERPFRGDAHTTMNTRHNHHPCSEYTSLLLKYTQIESEARKEICGCAVLANVCVKAKVNQQVTPSTASRSVVSVEAESMG